MIPIVLIRVSNTNFSNVVCNKDYTFILTKNNSTSKSASNTDQEKCLIHCYLIYGLLKLRAFKESARHFTFYLSYKDKNFSIPNCILNLVH